MAIVLVAGPSGDELLLIRRATVDGDPWSGHLALPGGGMEPEDRSLEDTARRETLEETGIDLTGSGRVAELTPVAPMSIAAPLVSVTPFVFRYTGDRRVTMSAELAEAWWVPIRELQRDGAWAMTQVTLTDGSALRVRGFGWHGYVLWGLTERILYEFLGSLGTGA